MTEAEQIKAISKILKKHFTNLNVEQTIDIAVDVVRALNSDPRS